MGSTLRHCRRKAVPRHHGQPALLCVVEEKEPFQPSLCEVHRRCLCAQVNEPEPLAPDPVPLFVTGRLVGALIGAQRAGLLHRVRGCRRPGPADRAGTGTLGQLVQRRAPRGPTDLPRKRHIHAMNQTTGQALTAPRRHRLLPADFPLLWCLAAASLPMFLDRTYSLGAGSVFALYISLYTAGRFLFELIRSDYANTILGLRVNTWVAALLFIAGLVPFQIRRRRPRSAVEHVRGSTTRHTPDGSTHKMIDANPKDLGSIDQHMLRGAINQPEPSPEEESGSHTPSPCDGC